MIQPSRIFCSSIVVSLFCGWLHTNPLNFNNLPVKKTESIVTETKNQSIHKKRQIARNKHIEKNIARKQVKKEKGKSKKQGNELDQKITFLRQNILQLMQQHDQENINKKAIAKGHQVKSHNLQSLKIHRGKKQKQVLIASANHNKPLISINQNRLNLFLQNINDMIEEFSDSGNSINTNSGDNMQNRIASKLAFESNRIVADKNVNLSLVKAGPKAKPASSAKIASRPSVEVHPILVAKANKTIDTLIVAAKPARKSNSTKTKEAEVVKVSDKKFDLEASYNRQIKEAKAFKVAEALNNRQIKETKVVKVVHKKLEGEATNNRQMNEQSEKQFITLDSVNLQARSDKQFITLDSANLQTKNKVKAEKPVTLASLSNPASPISIGRERQELRKEDEIIADGLIHGGRCDFDQFSERGVIDNLKRQGLIVSSDPEISNCIRLEKGNVLFAPSHRILIKLPSGFVKIEGGAIVLVMQQEDFMAVYDLHQAWVGAVQLVSNKKSIPMHPGLLLAFSKEAGDDFDALNLECLNDISYRNARPIELGQSKGFLAEFSIPSAITKTVALRQMLRSNGHDDRSKMDKILNDSIALMEASSYGGAYHSSMPEQYLSSNQ